MKPAEAHKDENIMNVKANLTLEQKHMRKYPPLQDLSKQKIHKKGKGNCSTRKETISKWSDRTFQIEKIQRDITLQRYYILEGLSRHYLRHELLLVSN